MDTKENYDLVIRYDSNWYNDKKTYDRLIELFHSLNEGYRMKVLLDLEKVEFIAANLLAVLGAILETVVFKQQHKLSISNIHPKVKKVMQMNGFRKYFKWEKVDDVYKSTIEYRSFQATTEYLEEFEKYIVLHVFTNHKMPTMSEKVRERMIDNFLEMFNNVIDHANTDKVFVCGQYFYKSGQLVLSIVDFGKTIKENVLEFIGTKNMPQNALQWAIVEGNSTKVTSAPGGLGFSMILNFIELNKGSFNLISDTEYYEINHQGKRRFLTMSNVFPGTIVTISFNLHDDFSYILSEEKNSEIIF